MKLQGLGLDGEHRAVVVLGAGASRGASCVRRSGVQPPLDADFFDQAARASGLLGANDRKLLHFIREQYGATRFPTLEEFFTQLEAVDRFHNEFNIRGRISRQFELHLGTLRMLIPRLLGAALADQNCRWHERLAHALRTRDSVISFNYDTLMDRALTRAGGKRWKPEVGYGFEASGSLDLWRPPPARGGVKYPIKLLKPHGSLNWNVVGETVELVTEYDAVTANSIVPPTWDKSVVADPPWNSVWRESRRALSEARLLIVTGYSVPATDQLSQALLRADVNNLRGLVLVNPDRDARLRMRSLFSGAIGSDCLVAELETLEDFAQHLPPGPSENPPIPVQPALRTVMSRQNKLLETLQRLESQLDDVDLDELQWSTQELEQTVGDLRSELDNAVSSDDLDALRGYVDDLESRIDSILGGR